MLKEVADPETTTPNGCICSSICGATLDGGNYEYDWCNTEDQCGEHSLIYGYWDKCLYLDSSKPDYVAQTWQEKQEQMWAKVTADDSIGPPPNPFNIMLRPLLTTNGTTCRPEGQNTFTLPVQFVHFWLTSKTLLLQVCFRMDKLME